MGAAALLSASITLIFAPKAAGSGIPEVKAYLNGTHIHDLLSAKTMLIKSIGTGLSVGSGIVVGPEGPMVHIGAAIGSTVPRAMTKAIGWWHERQKQKGDPHYSQLDASDDHAAAVTAGGADGRAAHIPADGDVNWWHSFSQDRHRRDFISMGSGAGLSAAFGAPIGGMLFALEEFASFWSLKLTWRTLVCTTICCFGFSFIEMGSGGDVENPGLMNFGLLHQKTYQPYELSLFAIM